MFNLLRSDVYRLVRGKMLWVGLSFLALVVVGAGAVVPPPQAASAMLSGRASASEANFCSLFIRGDFLVVAPRRGSMRSRGAPSPPPGSDGLRMFT